MWRVSRMIQITKWAMRARAIKIMSSKVRRTERGAAELFNARTFHTHRARSHTCVYIFNFIIKLLTIRAYISI